MHGATIIETVSCRVGSQTVGPENAPAVCGVGDELGVGGWGLGCHLLQHCEVNSTRGFLVLMTATPNSSGAKDVREKAVYSIPEAAGYLRIPISTLDSWAVGRRKANSQDYYPPVLSFVDQNTRLLSFYDLVEAHILRAAIDERVPLKQLKRGLEYLREKHPSDNRPLLTYDFLTEGKYLLVGGMLGSKKKDKEALVNASMHGQLEIPALLEIKVILGGIDESLELVGRDKNSKFPNILFPKDGRRVVSITPGVVSGRPAVEGTRIPTRIIAQRFHAGEDAKALAKDYRLSKEKIEAAIQYEAAA
jgi:uncharacterized protein (DUF433 family)